MSKTTPEAEYPEAEYLAFGIQSLDEMLGHNAGPFEAGSAQPTGYKVSPRESATFCLIGPDGTGKSIFALHLASEYWLRTGGKARILYASTDLSYDRANQVWENFWLDRPVSRRRRMPFTPNSVSTPNLDNDEKNELKTPLRLTHYKPAEKTRQFAEYLAGDEKTGDPPSREVAFIDLKSTTAGDDWNLLNTILAELNTPQKIGESEPPRHVLVIDAIEGLETLVGERDAFGEKQDRRTRITHIVRAAADKCHLVFIVEEPRDGDRLPEVFVADVVVRLRTTTERDYARRTLEFEKVRGQPHVRGQHDFRIRQGPSMTGVISNPDEPEVGCFNNNVKFLPAPTLTMNDLMSYIHVFPSLHLLSRDDRYSKRQNTQTTRTRTAGPNRENDEWRYAWFGIHQLDSMLARSRDYDLAEKAPGEDWAGADRMGLPIGTITTLIGNEATYKSPLAHAFLSQCFRARFNPSSAFNDPAQKYIWRQVLCNASDEIGGQGVAVLLTTADIDKAWLRDKLERHLIKANPTNAAMFLKEKDGEIHGLSPKNKAEFISHMKQVDRFDQRMGMEKRVLVRRLEFHHLPSAVLIHIVQRLINAARQELHNALKLEPLPGDIRERRAELQRRKEKYDWRIRFVIDDWTTLMATYPEVHGDPLFVPTLMSYLRREGVTCLILATQSGNPNRITDEEIIRERDIRDLRVYADNHLYTWHVPFYGERRVAITALPSLSTRGDSVVRELRRARKAELRDRLSDPEETGRTRDRLEIADREELLDTEALTADPHFELYEGLEEGVAEPVRLQVRLYAESDSITAFKVYLEEIKHLFRHMFGRKNEDHAVLQPEVGTKYDILREVSYLQSEARLDHTLVIQVDEFWAESRSELRRQERYLEARTVDRDHQAIKTEDPFGVFQLTTAAQKVSSDPLRRVEFYELIGHDYAKSTKNYPIHKVPYSWDFGFLLCDREAWQAAAAESDHRTRNPWREENKREQTVREIWNRLWKIAPDEELSRTQKLERGTPVAHYIKRDNNNNQKENAVGTSENEEPHNAVTWREFLGACKTVATAAKSGRLPFDVDVLAIESFSCLVLEIWMSEWHLTTTGLDRALHDNTSYHPYKDADPVPENKNEAATPQNARFALRNRRDYSRSASLRDRLNNGEFRRALYRTILLLDEVFGPSQFEDTNLVLTPRAADLRSVACRHWYSTAAALMANPESRKNLVAVGLPGSFAVRGDWFLGVARGSRSGRLGERAMDILCSRRSNITRLQTGLGLPVRDVHFYKNRSRERRAEHKTSLLYTDDKGKPQTVIYQDLRMLGAYDEKDGLGRRSGSFFWLWRSTIDQYDLQDRIWQKWLCRLMIRWRNWPRPAYRDGFDEYDRAVEKDLSGDPQSSRMRCWVDTDKNDRWKRFEETCRAFVETIDRAALRSDKTPDPPKPIRS